MLSAALQLHRDQPPPLRDPPLEDTPTGRKPAQKRPRPEETGALRAVPQDARGKADTGGLLRGGGRGARLARTRGPVGVQHLQR